MLHPGSFVPFEALTTRSATTASKIYPDQAHLLLGLLDSLFDLEQPEAVTAFLRHNSDLIPLLLESRGQVGLRFGEARMRLTLMSDPEATDDQRLYALVLTSLSPEEAERCLEKLDAEWWLDALPQARSRLTIDVEYL